MIKELTLYFIIAFAIGITWYRFLFFVVPLYFKRPFTRSIIRLRWHHLHWGILLIVIGSAILLKSESITSSSAIVLGLGLGLVIDLFIPSLLLETDREKELAVYRRSLFSTLLFAIGIIGLLIIFLII